MTKISQLFIILSIVSCILGILEIHDGKKNILNQHDDLISIPKSDNSSNTDPSPLSTSKLVALLHPDRVSNKRNIIEEQKKDSSIRQGMFYVVVRLKK